MKSVVINEHEWSALEGVPHLQFRIYLLLRWAMDRKTRRVGSASVISWGWIARELEVSPARGRHEAHVGRESPKALRSACESLVKLGLLEPCGNREFLGFLLPKATVALSRPNDEGQVRGRGEGQHEGQGKLHARQAIATHEGRHEGMGVNSDEGQQLRYQVNTLSVAAANAYTCPVENSAGVLLLPGEIAGFLNDAEKARGKIAGATESNPKVKAWAARGLTLLTLRKAYAEAIAARARDRSAAAINLGFLAVFVAEAMAPALSASEAPAKASASGWRATRRGIEKRGRALGLSANPGESWPDFERRVIDEDHRQDGALHG